MNVLHVFIDETSDDLAVEKREVKMADIDQTELKLDNSNGNNLVNVNF